MRDDTDRREVAVRDGLPARRRGEPTKPPDARAVHLAREVCRQLETRSESVPTLEVLGATLGVSPGHLQRTFKRVMGVSPRQYAAARRLERLKGALREGDTVTNALYEAGYGSSSRLYEAAPGDLGMTPGAYRRGGKGMRIAYTIVDCALGLLLVGATERGVCAVSLGDDGERLGRVLREEYPAAEIQRDDVGLAGWVDPIVRHLAGEEPNLDLPIDVQATAFQRRVWEALRKIPYGQTRSYRAIAEELGQPTAFRAVARACATNPVAVVVPCHRVVRSDGSLGGYRWGLQRKAALLEQEKG